MPLSPGITLRSRYEISETIGQGGMGRVYLALDRRLEGRRCAIKEVMPPPLALSRVARPEPSDVLSLRRPEVPPELDACPEPSRREGPAEGSKGRREGSVEGGADLSAIETAREQFRQEAQILAQLDHPNLPKVSDYFSIEERDYLVMDFVAGQDLKAIVTDARQRGRFLPENQVLMWADQLCDALTFLHNQEPVVLHRDVKPANIKLTPAGQIKLVDFGLVKSIEPENLETVTVVRGAGSLAYTPLEQFSVELGHTDVRSDIYALGATLYHLLTSQAPPTAQTHFLRPAALVPPSEINPAISPHVEDAILQAMSTHPEDRPASVEAFRHLLFAEPTSALAAAWDWPAILRANLPLIALALLMLAWAIFVTFR